MSTGLQVLHAIIANGSRATVRQLKEEHFFVGNEPDAYAYFNNHYRRYGVLPSLQAMRENGFPLTAITEPLPYYLQRLRDRAIYTVASDFHPQLRDALDAVRIDEVADLYRQVVSQITSFEGGDDIMSIQDAVAAVWREAIDVRQNGGTSTGVTLGWPTIDRLTAGAQPGEVWSVVARPNIGKSWTLIHMAKEAWLSGASLVFLTMEMTTLQIARRMIGAATGLNPDNIRRGRITSWGEDIVHDWIEGLPGLPPFHIMAGSFKKSTMDFDRVVQEYQPDIGYLDAQYLIQPAKKQRANGARWERVYDVGEEVKGIASDRGIPLVQSLQLGRDKKKGAENDLSQIAGGDVIGQISDGVVFVDVGSDARTPQLQRDYELGKNREGGLGKWRTNFLFNPVDFSELPPLDEEVRREQLRAEM